MIAVVGVSSLLVPGWADCAAAQSARQYDFVPAESRIYVVTHRSGLLSFLGHEHAVLVQDWSGELCWTEDSPARGRGALRADARTLVIDSDSARAIAGLGGGPSAGQLRTIRRKLIDADHLATEQYPSIALDSVIVVTTGSDRWVAEGLLTIRGVTRPVRVPFTVGQSDGAALRLSGTLPVLQSAFGIRPESIAGVVRVSDRVDIHFELVAVSSNRACTIEAT
jgi:polyisoprenoid-binding protein YceI